MGFPILFKKVPLLMCWLYLVWAMGTPSVAAQTNTTADSNVIEHIGDNGRVDWSIGVIQATGMGISPDHLTNPVQRLTKARRAAVVVARRNLLEVVKNVRIDSKNLVENFMAQNDEISTAVNELVKYAPVVKEINLTGGEVVQATVQIKFRGDFAQAVFPKTIRETPSPWIFSFETSPDISPNETPLNIIPDAPPPEISPEPETIYTGLIVDARGLWVRPAMAPRIIEEYGREVYGPDLVNKEGVAQQEIPGYAKSVETARENKRVFDTPLTITGIRAENHSDIVISSEDAELIRSAAEQINFLEKCNIIIVVD